MIRRYGPQFQFLSCAFDDVHNPHSFRLTFRQPDNSDFPSTASKAFLDAMKSGTSFTSGTVRIPSNWSALAAAATSNPIAVAFMYKRLIYNIATYSLVSNLPLTAAATTEQPSQGDTSQIPLTTAVESLSATPQHSMDATKPMLKVHCISTYYLVCHHSSSAPRLCQYPSRLQCR